MGELSIKIVVSAFELFVDVSSPRGIGIFLGFQQIQRFIEKLIRLGLGPHTPSLEDDDLGCAANMVPVTTGNAIIRCLIEARDSRLSFCSGVDEGCQRFL